MSNILHLAFNPFDEYKEEELPVGHEELKLPIYQGKTYEIVLQYTGDITGAELKGQIRNTYLETATNVLLAEFSFGVITYDSDDNLSTFTVRLEADETAAIPSTIKNLGNSGYNDRTCHVYDIEMLKDGNKSLIVRGYVQVVPEVTD